MGKKQTAVQWLIEELRKPYSDKYIADISNKALAMEREQIEEARQDGYESTYNSCESGCMGKQELDGSNKQYYTQTFKP